MSLLRINRFGRVEMEKTSTHQCGKQGHKAYDYHICIVVQENNLDKEGFVIDHVEIHETVVEFFSTYTGSCEKLEKELAEKIEKLCEKHKTFAIDMYIKLAPLWAGKQKANRAYMEYSKSGNFI